MISYQDATIIAIHKTVLDRQMPSEVSIILQDKRPQLYFIPQMETDIGVEGYYIDLYTDKDLSVYEDGDFVSNWIFVTPTPYPKGMVPTGLQDGEIVFTTKHDLIESQKKYLIRKYYELKESHASFLVLESHLLYAHRITERHPDIKKMLCDLYTHKASKYSQT
jgi:hypothetical protein